MILRNQTLYDKNVFKYLSKMKVTSFARSLAEDDWSKSSIVIW
jgi:hypothetical protein